MTLSLSLSLCFVYLPDTDILRGNNKVVKGVLVVNPGPLSKRKGPGTYIQMTIYPRKLTEEERAASGSAVGHHLFERARVDVLRI